MAKIKQLRLSNQITLIQMGEFEVQLCRKRIKNINLRIDRQGHVKVSAPMRCTLSVIQSFLQEKRDWITRHRAQLLDKQQSNPSLLLTGDSYQFLGKTYTLIIHENAKKQQFILDGHHLCCYLKVPATYERKQSLFRQWHRNQMSALIPDLLYKWEALIGVKVNQWGIKAMKTRWGSCNPTKKHIWLNLHLIHYPLSCLEYVIVHELVHLLEASHNKHFYALMSRFMPDWQVQRSILKAVTCC